MKWLLVTFLLLASFLPSALAENGPPSPSPRPKRHYLPVRRIASTDAPDSPPSDDILHIDPIPLTPAKVKKQGPKGAVWNPPTTPNPTASHRPEEVGLTITAGQSVSLSDTSYYGPNEGYSGGGQNFGQNFGLTMSSSRSLSSYSERRMEDGGMGRHGGRMDRDMNAMGDGNGNPGGPLPQIGTADQTMNAQTDGNSPAPLSNTPPLGDGFDSPPDGVPGMMGGGPMMGMGGMPVGGPVMGMGGMMSGPVGPGTASSLAAKLGYSPEKDLGITLAVGQSFAETSPFVASPSGNVSAGGPGNFAGNTTALAGQISYNPDRSFNLNLGASSSIPDSATPYSTENSAMKAFGGNTTNLIGQANYLPTKALHFSLFVDSLIPNEGTSISQFPAAGTPGAVTPTGTGPLTLLQPGVSYAVSDRFTLGETLTQTFNYDGIDSSFGVNGARTPGFWEAGLGNDLTQDTTVLSTKANFKITKEVQADVVVPYGFQSGWLDPTAGIMTNSLLYKQGPERFNLRLGLQATAPLSEISQLESKITTVTGTVGPSYRYEGFTFNYSAQVAYSFYENPYVATNSTTSTLMDPNLSMADLGVGGIGGPPDLMRTMNNASLSYRMSNEWTVAASGSVLYTSTRSGSLSWSSQATPFAVIYTDNPIKVSGNLSFRSNPFNDQVASFPNQPWVQAAISYTFGNPKAGASGTLRPPSTGFGDPLMGSMR